MDTVAQEEIQFLPTIGGEDNTFISLDSKYVVAAYTASRNLTVISTKTDEPVWPLYFKAGVRPVCV